MKWLEARHLDSWADRVDARARLSEIIATLVRASAAGISAFDFPTGDRAQRPGYDGRLTAVPAEHFRQFLPGGSSVWEFGTSKDYLEKANEDYDTRTGAPGLEVDPAKTTFVFVTPRSWIRNNPTRADWCAEKRADGIWKDVKAFDAIALEDWFEQCPAVAANVARDVLGTLPVTGALSVSEYWKEYSRGFEPQLGEEVLLAGREDQAKLMLQALNGGAQIHRWQGDSLDEVLAFAAACIRRSDEATRKFFESRFLLLETKDAARRLAGLPNLIFTVRGEAVELSGRLAADHPVILPLGRDSLREAAATRLNRPSTFEMAEALKTMGITDAECQRRAMECDRSVTILACRIPSAVAKRPAWHDNAVLIPALLAGAWNTASAGDCAVLAHLADEADYDTYEARIRRYRQIEDAPLESEGTVWAIRAPVNVFVNLANLLGAEHFAALEKVAHEVFGQLDPALDLAIDKRPFAQLHGATLPHSAWLREGLANTLLIIAALGEQSGLVVDGFAPQRFVNRVVGRIPALRDSDRVLSSLSYQLPLLMEAAPDPLLVALEHLLEGDGHGLLPIFQDAKEHPSFFAGSPHTGLLWALEMIAWDPVYLSRAASILLKLSRIDPGGTLANRPIRSLRHIFLTWLPGTNADLRQRLTVLDQLLEEDEATAWDLLVKLLPKGSDVGESGARPRYREAGASEREAVTRAVLLRSQSEIIHRAAIHAGASAKRWRALLQALHRFPLDDQHFTLNQLDAQREHLSDSGRMQLWAVLAEIVRRYKAYPDAVWSSPGDVIERLNAISLTLRSDDPTQEALWLFEERFPAIPSKNSIDFPSEVEELRKNAVQGLLDRGGIDAVVSLADRAEAPRFVGFPAGSVVRDVAETQELSGAALAHGERLNPFVSMFSAVAFVRFGAAWADSILKGYADGKLSQANVATLTLSWPHGRATWDYIHSFGADVGAAYWQSKPAFGLEGNEADLSYAVERYLAADRAESIVLGLALRAKEIPSTLLLETLDQFDQRITAVPELLKQANLDFDLQQFFSALRERKDATLEQIAVREYRYLSLLRESRAISQGAPPLALDEFMAQSPTFFVRILSDVFSPASERGLEKAAISEGARARAHIGWILIEGFRTIPGHSGDKIDEQLLEQWGAEVRRLAAESDRLTIAEQRIGALLAHAPEDPEDRLWPHQAIRHCLEKWQSNQIEHGISIERMNMRGGTWRGPREGGEQERALASNLREDANKLTTWPRIQRLLVHMAEHWVESGRQEDIQARQDEMRE